ncbi:MAG: hypothetical protein ACR2NF_00215 [Pirellulales bacterium]
MATVQQNSPGTITKDTIYSLPEVKSRLGISDSGLREARRKGLPIHRLGKRGFVSGAELIAFVTKGDEGDAK